MIIVLRLADDNGVGWQMWSTGAARDGELCVNFHTDLVPEVLCQEGVEGLTAALNDERLDVVGMKAGEVQRVGR